jgi:hypothetical protein
MSSVLPPSPSVESYQAVPPLLYRSRKRAGWGWAAFWAALWAVLLEGTLHPLASMVFDPIGNVSTFLLYLFVVATLGINEVILDWERGRWLYERIGWRRLLGLSLAATVVSLLVTTTVCVMFAPLMVIAAPFALLGVPLLLYVPLLVLIILCFQLGELRWTWDAIEAPAPVRRRIVAATGLLALTVLAWVIGRPLLTARYVAMAESSDTSENRRAIAALRFLHGEGTLLDMAYNRSPAFWTALGYNTRKDGLRLDTWYPTHRRVSDESVQAARRNYFFVTGQPFEQAPRPSSYARQQFFLDRNDDIAIEETGGLVVGRKVPGLWLKTSEIHGTVDPEAGVAVYEWKMRFRNDTDDPQEARADIRLPNDAVVHKVSLWINGEERPAAFGHPQKVREAYQSVAVVQRKDPLLVTMPAPGHVLAQCFPVPAHGEMQIRLGVTTRLGSLSKDMKVTDLRFPTPVFGPVNFDTPKSLEHRLFLMAADAHKTPLTAPDGNMPSLFEPESVSVGPPARRTFLRDCLRKPVNLILVRDASVGMNGRVNADALIAEIADLPQGSLIRLLDTDENPKALLDRLPADADDIREWTKRRFVGGTDPAPVLAAALETARDPRGDPGMVVFLHAASPHKVSDPAPLRKALQRDFYGGPPLIFVQMTPKSPDALYLDLAGFPMVQSLNGSGIREKILATAVGTGWYAGQAKYYPPQFSEITVNLKEMLAEEKWPAWKPETIRERDENPLHRSRDRIGCASFVLFSWYRSNLLPEQEAMDMRILAGKVAAKHRLVTPLSSAVVLETKQQYKEHGLDDGTDEQEPVAVSPEPGTLGLVAFGAIGGAAFWRRRFRRAA